LSHNGIGKLGCEALASAVQSMSSLQILDYKYNHQPGCDVLAPALLSLPSLRTSQKWIVEEHEAIFLGR
jgi:hypothetical protein